MNLFFFNPLFFIIYFVCLIVIIETGRRVGLRKIAPSHEGAGDGLSVVESAMLALLAFIVGLTFTNGVLKLDQRRALVAEEVNAIGTAYLRLDLLPPDSRNLQKERFFKYVDSRIKTYQLLPDEKRARAELAISRKIQQKIWDEAVASCEKQGANSDAGKLLLMPCLTLQPPAKQPL